MKSFTLYRIVLVGLLMASTTLSYAQSGDAMRKLNAARIGLITERLGLTPDQAEKFWPLYQEYQQKRKTIQSDFKQMRKSYDRNTATEEETRRVLKKGQEIKQQKLNLEQEYSNKMLEVIDSKQLMSLKQAEGDFRQMLLKRLDQRRDQQRNREDYRQRNQQRMDQQRRN